MPVFLYLLELVQWIFLEDLFYAFILFCSILFLCFVVAADVAVGGGGDGGVVCVF